MEHTSQHCHLKDSSPSWTLQATKRKWIKQASPMDRRVAHIGSRVRTNPPSFAKFRFFSCSLYERAPCLVITRRLCSSNAEIWSNGTVMQRVHESRALGVATTSTEAGCDQRQRVHFSFSSIAQRAVCHSCKVLQSTMKRTKESDMDGQAKLFSFGFSRGRNGNQLEPNPSSSGSSEQNRKPSFSKESTSSQLEQEQRCRSQTVTAARFYSRVRQRVLTCRERCGRGSLTFRQARISEERKRSYRQELRLP